VSKPLALLTFAVLLGPPAAGAEDYPALGREVVRLVRDHFLDAERARGWAERARGWAERNEHYAGAARDGAGFATLTNAALGQLGTSHTRYYRRGSAEYWALRAIFAGSLGGAPVEYASIGADVDERRFVRRVFAGGPAAQAGLLRGDRIVALDGEPYDPIDPFEGRADSPVVLAVERFAGRPPLELTVVPRRVRPLDEWLAAQREGSRILSRDGVGVAYLPLLWCVGDEVEELLRQQIAVEFRDAAALVLDLRDGWGGCNPEFLNHFNTAPPVLTLVDREGNQRTFDPQWRKPLYVLINGGSRSGKEVVAHAVRRQRRGTLVGQPTAGFVVGGRPFLLSDDSLLYLAVLDTLVDGERLEGVGVLPDVDVPDRLDYAAGADPQLERAVELASRPESTP
jgi:carboxyl-terminal processing protease